MALAVAGRHRVERVPQPHRDGVALVVDRDIGRLKLWNWLAGGLAVLTAGSTGPYTPVRER